MGYLPLKIGLFKTYDEKPIEKIFFGGMNDFVFKMMTRARFNITIWLDDEGQEKINGSYTGFIKLMNDGIIDTCVDEKSYAFDPDFLYGTTLSTNDIKILTFPSISNQTQNIMDNFQTIRESTYLMHGITLVIMTLITALIMYLSNESDHILARNRYLSCFAESGWMFIRFICYTGAEIRSISFNSAFRIAIIGYLVGYFIFVQLFFSKFSAEMTTKKIDKFYNHVEDLAEDPSMDPFLMHLHGSVHRVLNSSTGPEQIVYQRIMVKDDVKKTISIGNIHECLKTNSKVSLIDYDFKFRAAKVIYCNQDQDLSKVFWISNEHIHSLLTTLQYSRNISIPVKSRIDVWTQRVFESGIRIKSEHKIRKKLYPIINPSERCIEKNPLSELQENNEIYPLKDEDIRSVFGWLKLGLSLSAMMFAFYESGFSHYIAMIIKKFIAIFY